jgi:hypothetical protein
MQPKAHDGFAQDEELPVPGMEGKTHLVKSAEWWPPRSWML